jgi:hypothetical protein
MRDVLVAWQLCGYIENLCYEMTLKYIRRENGVIYYNRYNKPAG